MNRKLANLLLIPMLLVALLAALVIVTVFFPEHAPGVDPFDPPDFTPTPAPSDWSRFELDLHPVAVEPVALDKIPVRRIALPEHLSSSLIQPTSDGGCLAVSYTLADPNDASGKSGYYLRGTRFKADGSVLWDSRYENDPFTGYPVSLCIFPDDSFAVSIRLTDTASAEGLTLDQLVRFTAYGTKSWQSSEGQTAAGALDHLFAGPDGAVLAAGSVTTNQTDGNFENKISLLRFDKGGGLSGQLQVSGSGNQLLSDAAYTEESGLVLVWWRETTGEQSSPNAGFTQIAQAGCFGADFSQKWIKEMEPGINLYNVQILPDGKGILAFGNAPAPEGFVPDTAVLSTIFHLTSQGSLDWTYSPDEANKWLMNAAMLSDGRIIAGKYDGGAESGNISSLLVFPEDSQTPEVLAGLPGTVQQLIPTRDGGITAVSQQSVRTIPQPPYVSSIWTDTAVIIAHYDRYLKLVWQRTIDQYKHSLRGDIVIATVDDRLLVG